MTTLEELLTLHIRNSDINKIKETICMRINMNYKDECGFSYLELAVCFDNLEIIKLFLQYKPINIEIFEIGIYTFNYDTIKILLEYCIECKITPKDLITNNSSSCLHMATIHNKIEIAELLLEYCIGRNNNCDIIVKNNAATCLNIAASNGNIEFLKLLLNYGLDINIQSDLHCTILHSAAKGLIGKEAGAYTESIQGNYNCMHLIKWVLENYDINPFIKDINGLEPRDIINNFYYRYAEEYDDILEELGFYE